MTARQDLRSPSTNGASPDTLDELLVVEHASKSFAARGGRALRRTARVRAVRDVSLAVRRGEALGLVGESGCGKSTLARLLVQLEAPDSGRILYEGVDISSLGARELRRSRRRVQMVFQDPYSSLTPRMTIARLLEEPLKVHRLVSGKAARRDRVAGLLQMVGLLPDMADRYPHEFSGGQRQRIAIARALAHEPSVLVCDEAVSALDVSVQAQILSLLKELQETLGLTYLFITHDLGAARFLSDRIAVMYLGRVVELARSAELFASPLHPYTRALISSVPVPDPFSAPPEWDPPVGEPPSPSEVIPGCSYHPRCPIARDDCLTGPPALLPVRSSHSIACIAVTEDAPTR